MSDINVLLCRSPAWAFLFLLFLSLTWFLLPWSLRYRGRWTWGRARSRRAGVTTTCACHWGFTGIQIVHITTGGTLGSLTWNKIKIMWFFFHKIIKCVYETLWACWGHRVKVKATASSCQSWCHLKAHETRNMHTKYKLCTLYSLKITSKIKVCRQRYKKMDRPSLNAPSPKSISFLRHKRVPMEYRL